MDYFQDYEPIEENYVDIDITKIRVGLNIKYPEFKFLKKYEHFATSEIYYSEKESNININEMYKNMGVLNETYFDYKKSYNIQYFLIPIINQKLTEEDQDLIKNNVDPGRLYNESDVDIYEVNCLRKLFEDEEFFQI